MLRKFSLAKCQELAIRKLSSPELHFHVDFIRKELVASPKIMRMGGQSYLHVCSVCFKNGKSYSHPSKDCKKSKNE